MHENCYYVHADTDSKFNTVLVKQIICLLKYSLYYGYVIYAYS